MKNPNTIKSRIHFLIAILILASFLFLQSGKAQTSTTPAGTGTLASPYQIATLNNLYWLSQTSAAWVSGKYCIQTANIDASSTSTWASGAGFTPIGSTGGYFGNYNGQGFSIDGLTENRPAYADRAGMFYSTRTGAVIQNVVLTNVNIIGGGSGAALVSYQMGGSVSNCSSSGNVQGLYSTGGLIGAMDAGTVSNSYSTANVYGRLNLTNGIVEIGGFVGELRGTATDCYATGNITGGQSYSGAGGFAGACYSGSIIRSYAAGTITGSGTKGGLAGAISGGTYTDSYYDKTLLPNLGPGTGKTTAEMKTQATFTNWDFTTIWNIDASYNTGYPILRAFTYFAAPTTSSFTPTSAATGATVTITGTNFTGATAVKFGGTDASSFTVVSATSITAVVAAGTTGTITVTTPGGTATLAGFTFTVTLAIDKLNVHAYPKNNDVQVDWNTISETDMDRYEVERSTDGINFSKQHTTNALGNSSTVVNYTWADANPQPGNNFYRIKAFDKGGMFKYSAVIKVVAAKLLSGITIIANPVVGNNFSLSFNKIDKGIYQVVLINNLGQIRWSKQIELEGGSVVKKFVWDASIGNGVYYLTIKRKDVASITIKVIKN